MTLTEFLLARIAEDREVAWAAIERNGADWSIAIWDDEEGARINGTTDKGNPRACSDAPELWDDEGALWMFTETAKHIARHDPARVLAECEAKRQIVAEHSHYEMTQTCNAKILPILAMPYADHPDYLPKWKL